MERPVKTSRARCARSDKWLSQQGRPLCRQTSCDAERALWMLKQYPPLWSSSVAGCGDQTIVFSLGCAAVAGLKPQKRRGQCDMRETRVCAPRAGGSFSAFPPGPPRTPLRCLKALPGPALQHLTPIRPREHFRVVGASSSYHNLRIWCR